jgi:hypothetical protein
MDVFWDVLQFRDHVMTHDEGAERLVHDIRLAKRLGFANVRVLATHPLEVMVEPMAVIRDQVREIADYVEQTETRRARRRRRSAPGGRHLGAHGRKRPRLLPAVPSTGTTCRRISWGRFA